MQIERTQTIRERENLEKIFSDARIALERALPNDHSKILLFKDENPRFHF